MTPYINTYYANADDSTELEGGWLATTRYVGVGTEGDDEDQAEVRLILKSPNDVRLHVTVCPDLDEAYGWDAVVGEFAARWLDDEQLQALLELAREALAAKRAE